jgi:hypothetical protein
MGLFLFCLQRNNKSDAKIDTVRVVARIPPSEAFFLLSPLAGTRLVL